MSASEKRIEANRKNALRSTGPRTAEGKGNSKRNALKHGLAGKGECLPPDLRQELQGQLDKFHRALRPRDDAERALVEHAALGHARFLQANQGMQILLADRVRNAVRRWDEARDETVRALGRDLEKGDAGAARALETTHEGCEWLLGQWDVLADVLEERGRWTGHQYERAQRLLGAAGLTTTHSEPRLADLYLCHLVARDEPIMATTLARFFDEPADAADQRTLPTLDEARGFLRGLIAGELDRLEALRHHLWEAYDRPARNDATERVFADVDPEVGKLRRYAADAIRQTHSSIRTFIALSAELRRRRAEDERPPAERPWSAPARDGARAAPSATSPARNEANARPGWAAEEAPGRPADTLPTVDRGQGPPPG